jgi:uncharacterized membrane protein YkgB
MLYAKFWKNEWTPTKMKTLSTPEQDLASYADPSNQAKSKLTKLAAWTHDRNLPFLITGIGMIVMLLWSGSYKMTAPGAEGIVPLVSNSPLIRWHFKVFGPYIGSDLIGLTEIVATALMIAGYLRPKAGIIGGLIAVVMFFITSTMVITTPGAIISVPGIHGMRYMSFWACSFSKMLFPSGFPFTWSAISGSRPSYQKTGANHQIEADPW